MTTSNMNGVNGLASHNWGIKDEIIAGYDKIKNIKFAGHPMFWFNLENGIRVWIEKDHGMWQVSVSRNWNSFKDPGETLLDRRAFNLDENYKTLRWSDKVINKAVELIEKTIA